MQDDAFAEAEGGDEGEVSNTCTYAGEVYSEGAVVCMDGTEYRCMNVHGRSFTWEPTGRSCGGEGDASSSGGDGSGDYGGEDSGDYQSQDA
jgi:hypothetical protein